jgi:hypothetical protein
VPDEELSAKLIVPDTGPLITLAAADSLDYLLYPGVPVYVPDAVLYEATVRGDALGAQSVAAWVQGHSQQVFPLVTQTFADHLAMLGAGLKAPRDLGERAAIEAAWQVDAPRLPPLTSGRLRPLGTCCVDRVTDEDRICWPTPSGRGFIRPEIPRISSGRRTVPPSRAPVRCGRSR